MAYKQTKAFNQAKGGTKPYYCLQNVRLGYETAPLYDDAWTAWKNTQQHKNRTIPKGVDVPLYYSYTATIGGVRKNYGHINVRLANGTIWNDGKIFPNLKSFEQAWSNVHYVGWGESVNKMRVIKKEDDMFQGKTAKQWFSVALRYDKRIKALTAENKKLKKDLATQTSYKLTWRKRYENATTSVKALKDKIINLVRKA